MQTVQMVFLESPTGDEIKEVEATSETLTRWMVAGWHQVPPPAKHETVTLANAKEGK